MPDFGIFRGFGEKLAQGQTPTQLGKIGSESFGFTGLLDLYPNAAAAYSVRKLRLAYTGSAIRVRNASNAEADIGFVNNVLDTASLLSHCGSGNGFVTTWYDQSGNGRDATQTTAANQPQIVSSGSVLNKNGKPALTFNKSNSNRLVSSFGQTLTSQSSFAVISIDSTTDSYGRIFSQSGNGNDNDSNNYIPIIRRGSSTTVESYLSGDAAEVSFTNSTQFFLSSIHSGSLITNQLNNNTANTAIKNLNSTVNKIAIGGLTTTTIGTGYLNGEIQEIITYYSDELLNRSGFATNINTYYGIY
jgi:hypothetical protein